ncbi:MAG TPA: hypothetical protein H9824_03410 [Candidatus Bacteroides pullicola]|uniref:Uncharacterized protein n=1 Tax=Candidatus Bacteroides pullicola TaxID=2838475 RepID=A0A9D1ZHA4_9BACE|nr:hypothetical protein [Candidatus Bacteroides pullicola]
MEFTFDEKAACFYALEIIGECDGQLTEEEKDLLIHLMSSKFGVTFDDMILGVHLKYHDDRDAGKVLGNMPKAKRNIFQEAMEEMAGIDPMNIHKCIELYYFYNSIGIHADWEKMKSQIR